MSNLTTTRATYISLVPVTVYTHIPLTTVFSPPASCFDLSYTLQGQWNDTITSSLYPVFTTTDTIFEVTRGYRPECYPANFSNLGQGTTAGYYTPGICPSGWTTASISLDGTTTHAGCCPTVPAYVLGNSSCVGQFRNVTVGDGSVTSIASYGYVTQRAISIIFQAKDLSLFSTSTSANITSSTTTATPSPSIPSPTITATSTPNQTSSSLSPGVEAGIGVGVSLGAIAVIFIAVLFWWRRRKGSKKTLEQAEDSSGKPELDGEGKKFPELDGHGKQKPELGAEGMREMNGAQRPGELGAGQMPAELDSHWRGWEAPVS